MTQILNLLERLSFGSQSLVFQARTNAQGVSEDDEMSVNLSEIDGRLLLEFYEPVFSPDGNVSIMDEHVRTIDITAHIERAVEAVLDRRELKSR
jgi:hypothetical protein